MKLAKVYDPSLFETDIYALWEKTESFKPRQGSSGKPYAIVVPPPNANGNAHLGTAITLYLEDIAARYHRLQGDTVLFLPGADHAGFETQVVYEKKLAVEGKSRFDFSREELYAQIWDFVAENRQNFEQQFRQFGGSLDWSRYTFTLDGKIVKRAYATFKKMWDEGLIYRGERLVNYCTFHGTAFSDIEVVHKEEQGTLWYIRYPLTDGSGELVVATTRPETMLGDTGVAVHPEDERYKKFVGKTIKLPLTNREIPIIADEFVDREFGTGAVKLTPGHDQNDYDASERHDLPKLTIIDHEGKVIHHHQGVAGKYNGMTIKDARTSIVADLKEQDLLLKSEDLTHNVGHCYKCDTAIEPLLREQWFVNMKPLAADAIEALEANKITFYPDAKKTQLATYLKGLRDWNLSRQIAWGIPIPAFQNVDDPSDWIYDERVTEEFITVGDKSYHRDPDVFDTWFSSSSWPYATLNSPFQSGDQSGDHDVEASDDFKEFYPLGLMETGGEIMYPWVSRMLMLGLYVTGEIPFKVVYIHGYVMAEDGAKMSKSLGNVLDPIPVIQEHGSDALRMGLIAGRAPAVNRGYDTRKVVDGRNFCNKLWNVARYIEDKVGDEYQNKHKATAVSPADHWVLSELQRTSEVMTGHLDEYRFSEAYETLYHFVWDDFADWYIEASKAALNPELLVHCLEAVLKLTHPFAPFLTETIWQTLAWEGDSILAQQLWPEVASFDKKAAVDFEEIRAIITESRLITKSLNVASATLYYTEVPLLASNAELVARMARLEAVTAVRDGTGVYLTTTKYRCWLDIDRSTAEAYQVKLADKKAAAVTQIERLEGRLSNKKYVHDAPKQVVEQTRTQLEEAQSLLANIEREVERFQVNA